MLKYGISTKPFNDNIYKFSLDKRTQIELKNLSHNYRFFDCEEDAKNYIIQKLLNKIDSIKNSEVIEKSYAFRNLPDYALAEQLKKCFFVFAEEENLTIHEYHSCVNACKKFLDSANFEIFEISEARKYCEQNNLKIRKEFVAIQYGFVDTCNYTFLKTSEVVNYLEHFYSDYE